MPPRGGSRGSGRQGRPGPVPGSRGDAAVWPHGRGGRRAPPSARPRPLSPGASLPRRPSSPPRAHGERCQGGPSQIEPVPGWGVESGSAERRGPAPGPSRLGCARDVCHDDNSEEGFNTIHSGRHEYAFSFELPQTPLATSFEGRHGSVRYWVKAELHRPWLLPVKLKKEFTVFEHIDINTPSLLSPQAGTKDKTLCCWFCASGPISLSAKIERKGYTPGESIQIFAEIENCSSRMVVPKAAIYQTQAFYAKGKMKEVKQLVANLRGESLSSGKTDTWNGKLLKIPPVSPSILDCSIIRVEYSLMVYVDIPGAMDLFLNLPLVIGTIPLHPFGSRTSSVSSQCSMNMNWLGLSLPERPEEHVVRIACIFFLQHHPAMQK
ncbi:arrestin domain-containing protein 3 isoform X3 [Mesocricetus auratus]|uniref:Arrestin domain-containing protein 3 n=1 Tax=Mesocricetus auratus TaxID=10036 RepID=A0ABM2W2L4_MESAU|nr:arrestin domain-containing protein 3 isoform X3 [Mesocricetus auratus]